MMDKDTEEAEVLAGCMEVLDTLGIYHWRQNTGAFKTQSGGFFGAQRLEYLTSWGFCLQESFLQLSARDLLAEFFQKLRKTFCII